MRRLRQGRFWSLNFIMSRLRQFHMPVLDTAPPISKLSLNLSMLISAPGFEILVEAAVVIAHEHECLRLRLGFNSRDKIHAWLRVQHTLGYGEGQGWTLSQPPGPFVCGGEQLGMRHNAIYQAVTFRGRGVDGITQQE